MDLKKMSQDQLIDWIRNLTQDEAFTLAVKQKFINGIKDYKEKNKSAVTGEDFDDAEEADDIMLLAPGVDKRMAKMMLKKIEKKKAAEFKEKKKQRADTNTNEQKDQSSGNDPFTLQIQAMRGKMYKIKNVTKHTEISTIRWKFLNELGADSSAKSEYGGNLDKITSGERKIEIKKNGVNMEDNKTLGSYGIVNGTHLPLVVTFKVKGGADEKYEDDDDPDQFRNRRLKRKKMKQVIGIYDIEFPSLKPDCIMGYTDEDNKKRVEMPCGCSYASDTVYRFMKSIFNTLDFKTATKAICPMPKGKICKGNDKQREWPWELVFIIADLSDKERGKYAKALENRLSGSKDCPHCGATTERPDDLRISRVRCETCNKSDWCWNCRKVWKAGGLGPICGNNGCMADVLNGIVKNCGKVKAPWSNVTNKGQEMPQTRACPKCLSSLEYVQDCKHIECICCPYEFCFNCLGDWKAGACSLSKTCDPYKNKVDGQLYQVFT